ncbi:glycosyltransferase family 4 protein [Maribacter polysiphoniae]|uniref:Glycosyltransferase family 4 protein n=1 Tax=Maribacter polysiphoniae TaxID=429344 RepID=A0A316DUH1_9FLAO|nr:glycosyltransferase family 4 protein [Maribacter polysiphoniae]MBD1262688.1 glycosyltransferase family 4 protein [Maribacter polysiphoniae]PWK21108.1 glycosyltransferase involved in cell wall biosynthesis [Maribacter polysiphoniae]
MVEVKKIIFLALQFSNAEKGNTLWTDLVQEFHHKGHDILVLAPALDESKIGLRIEAGVKVLRVKTNKLFNVGLLQKGIANLMLPYQYKNVLKKNKIPLDFDLILLPTPPITLIDVGLWIKKKSQGKLYLILRDIFPQNAVDLKMMKTNGLIHSYFRKKEIKLYEKSDSIGCMSPANVEYVKKHNPYLDMNKLHLLPNWERLPNFDVNGDVGSIKSKYGLSDKFIVIFGGNIGRPQKLENIVELAKSCSEIQDLVFYIIGNGTEKGKIANMVKTNKMTNMIFKNSIPKRDYYQLLRAADIGLISLSEDFTIPNFPSKVLSYYGAKKPVLASLDLQTDFGKMLEETNSGLWAEAGNKQELKEKLVKLYESKELREQLGKNGYEYMKANLQPNKAYTTIIKAIATLN